MMATKKLRIFFTDTSPLLPAFQASDGRFYRFLQFAENMLAIDWAHRDLITKAIVYGKQRKMNTI
jgi:hypothetical protein